MNARSINGCKALGVCACWFVVVGFANPAPPTLDYHSLAQEGRNLSGEEVEAIEAQLQDGEEHLARRIRLLGYYWAQRTPEGMAAHAKHALWFIRHHPEAEVTGTPYAELNSILQPEAYAEGRDLWLKHIDAHPKDTAILGNAAEYFTVWDPNRAIELVKQAQRLEPDDPRWPERLGHLYALAGKYGTDDTDLRAAKRSLEAYEQALAKTKGAHRGYLLVDVAKAAQLAGESDKARKYATELLDTAVEGEPDWNYGNAIHQGNLVLGHVALAADNLEEAERYLLRAGKTPGSPQLNSFGPNMLLAQKLLSKGRRTAVIEYLKLCKSFWNDGRLDRWIATIEGGGTPDFGANLYY